MLCQGVVSRLFQPVRTSRSVNTMARQLDNQQQRELTNYVNRLFELAGYSSTAEWARESGYPPSNLSNLRNGVKAVDGYNLLRLIRAAAARIGTDPEDLALQAPARRPDGPGSQAAEFERRLEEVEGLVFEGFRRLEAGISRVEQRLELEGDQGHGASTK